MKSKNKNINVLTLVLTGLLSSTFVEPAYAAENDVVAIKNIDSSKTAYQIKKELAKALEIAEDALEENQDLYKAVSKKLVNYKEELADLQKKAKSFNNKTSPNKVKKVNSEIAKYTTLVNSQEKVVATAQAKLDASKAEFTVAQTKFNEFTAAQKAREAELKASQMKARAEEKAQLEAPKIEKRKLESNLDKAKSVLDDANDSFKTAKKKVANSKEDLADLQKKLKKAKPDQAKNLTNKIEELSAIIKTNEAAVVKAQEKVTSANDSYVAAKKALDDFCNSQNQKKQLGAKNKQNQKKVNADKKTVAKNNLRIAEAEMKAAQERYEAVLAHERLSGDISKTTDKLADTRMKMDAANVTLADAQKALAAEEKKVAAIKDSVKAGKATKEDLNKAEAALDLAKENVRQMKIKAENLAALNKHTEKVLNAQKDKLNKIPAEYTVSSEGLGSQGAIVAAENILDAASENLANARHAYNMSFQKKASFVERSLSEKEVAEIINNVEKRTGLKFAGDVNWFASLEINGDSLFSPFIETLDKEEAVKRAKQRAIDAGFYLIGIDLLADGKTVLIDKGSIGNINVQFGKNYVTENGNEFYVTEPIFFTEQQIKNKFGEGKKTDAIEPGKVFNFNTIQNRFYDLNAHPDIARADIKFIPNSDIKKRAFDVNVFVEEKDGFFAPAHFIFGVDNFGSMDGADEWMGRGTLQFLNLWHKDHAITLNGNYSLGGSLYGFAGSYYIPRLESGRWYDFAWTLHGGYTDVSTEDVVPTIDVEGKGYFTGLQVSKRLFDRRESALDLSLGLTYRYVDSALIIDGQKWAMGKEGEGYEILPLSLALIYTDKKVDSLGGRNYATLEAVHNVGGSSLEEMQYYRATIDDEAYTLVRAQIARLQLLGDYTAVDASGLWMLFAKLDSQFADGPLNGAEQFGLGGHGTVRGYEERQFMADSGVSGTFEIRTPLVLGIFDRTPNQKLPWDRMQFVGFFDYGWYTLEDGLGEGEDDSEFICSVGLGLRFAGSENAQLRFDWGIPLIKDDEKFDTDSAGRIHLSMQVQF